MVPLLPPLSWLFACAALAVVAGLLGGMGGRTFATRLRFGAVWEALDALERRLSKREGSAGQAQRQSNQAEIAQLRELLLAASRSRGPQLVTPTEDANVAARELFAAQEKGAVKK